MSLMQTAGISLLILMIGSWIYLRCQGKGLRILTKLLILVNALLLFLTLNLYYAAKNEIAVKKVIEKYSVSSTVDLLKLMHETGHSVEMQDNRLVIDKDTDHTRIFILMREPFFHIIDQGKMMQMTKELPN